MGGSTGEREVVGIGVLLLHLSCSIVVPRESSACDKFETTTSGHRCIMAGVSTYVHLATTNTSCISRASVSKQGRGASGFTSCLLVHDSSRLILPASLLLHSKHPSIRFEKTGAKLFSFAKKSSYLRVSTPGASSFVGSRQQGKNEERGKAALMLGAKPLPLFFGV
ncbi:hypothetical protein BJ170DRAFT_388395 [Xylariales sp. AK1849]|nr:hypothetical protein BJ170DRAFT_388395 [Xylariales sp. AK1849]